MARSFRKRIAALSLGVVATLVALEVALRFLPVNTGLATQRVDDACPILRFAPNAEFVWSKGWAFDLATRGHVNAQGFVHDDDYAREGQRPLVAVLGDSYVEALMVPHPATLQGRLATLANGHARVYSYAASGAPLSQYLAYAEFAATEVAPDKLVVVVVGNDFDESLLRYRRRAGFHHFAETEDGGLDLVQLDYTPSTIRRLGRAFALVRYLRLNGTYPRPVAATAAEYWGNTRGDFDEERLRWSERATLFFLDALPVRSRLEPADIVLVVDGLRQAIYAPELLEAAQASYFGRMRRFLLAAAEQRGFRLVDLQTVFAQHFAAHGARFEFETDAHWNARGHDVAARAVAAVLGPPWTDAKATDASIR